MKVSQVHLLAEDAIRAEGERQASMISAVNLGSHGKSADIKRELERLMKTEKKIKSVDEALKVANKARGK
jgi:hypothetical protein